MTAELLVGAVAGGTTARNELRESDLEAVARAALSEYDLEDAPRARAALSTGGAAGIKAVYEGGRLRLAPASFDDLVRGAPEDAGPNANCFVPSPIPTAFIPTTSSPINVAPDCPFQVHSGPFTHLLFTTAGPTAGAPGFGFVKATTDDPPSFWFLVCGLVGVAAGITDPGPLWTTPTCLMFQDGETPDHWNHWSAFISNKEPSPGGTGAVLFHDP